MNGWVVHSISVENFFTHRREHVIFPPKGTILLWGPTGVGKSSLLSAIPYALSGPKALQSRASSEDMKHELYSDMDMHVSVEFANQDGILRIERGLKGKTPYALLVEPDGTETSGVSAVNERVKTLLGGMDGPTLYSTYFSQQNELDQLLQMQPRERRAFVQRILGVSLLDGVISTAKREYERVHDRAEILSEQHVGVEHHSLVVECDEARALLTSVESDRQRTEFRMEAAQAEWDDIHSAWETIQHQFHRHERVFAVVRSLQEHSLPGVERRFLSAQKRLQELESAQSFCDENQWLRVEWKELQNQLKAYQTQQLAQAKRSSFIQEHLEAVQQLKDHQVNTVIQPDSQKLAAIQRKLAALHEKRAEMRAQYSQYSAPTPAHVRLDGGQSCPTCLQEVGGEAAAAIECHYNELEALRINRLDAIKEQGINVAKAIVDVESQQIQFLACETQHNAWKREGQRLQTEVTRRKSALPDDTSEMITNPQERLDSLQEQWQVITQLEILLHQRDVIEKEHLHALQERTESVAKLGEAAAEMADIAFDNEIYNQLDLQQSSLQRERGSAREEFTRLQGEEVLLQERVKVLDTTIAAHKAWQEDREHAHQQSDILQRLYTNMKDFRTHIIGSIRPELESRTSTLVQEISSGDIISVGIDEEYGLFAQRHGGLRKLSSFSGGQKAQAALAIRVALTQLLSARTDTPIQFMVFDEIFGTQDPEHRRSILESLHSLQRVYPQIFLISHEENLRDSELIDLLLDIPSTDGEERITSTNR